MSISKTFLAAVAACTIAIPAFADGIMINDAYARSSGPSAKSGAAFMMIMNKTDQDDRLISATSDIAKRVELHTHIEGENGIMMMREVEDGFSVEAQGKHMLMRGGDHIMFMGLLRPMEQGDTITVNVVFEKAGEMTIEIPVDLERKPADGMMKMHTHGTESN